MGQQDLPARSMPAEPQHDAAEMPTRIRIPVSGTMSLEFDPTKITAASLKGEHETGMGDGGFVIRKLTGKYTLYLDFEGEENRPLWVDAPADEHVTVEVRVAGPVVDPAFLAELRRQIRTRGEGLADG